MSDTNSAGTIFIKEDTPLPANLPIESEAFLPGWRAVKNLDRSTLARNIEGANWSFFYLAGEIRATVLGRDRSGTLRRAVKCVLANIQQGIGLVPAKDLGLRMPAAPNGEVALKQYVALISST